MEGRQWRPSIVENLEGWVELTLIGVFCGEEVIGRRVSPAHEVHSACFTAARMASRRRGRRGAARAMNARGSV